MAPFPAVVIRRLGILSLILALHISPVLAEKKLDATLQIADASPLKISTFKDQWLLLNFWAAWCRPCREEIPLLSRWHSEYPHIQVVGFTMEHGDGRSLQTFLDLVAPGYPVTEPLDGPWPFEYPRPEVLPSTWVIDPRGELVANLAGQVEWNEVSAVISGGGQAADCMNPQSGQDLRHCALGGLQRPGIQLDGVILDGVDLSNAQLPGCSLRGASLAGADLKWADLSGCDLSEAQLTDADLFHTTFDGGTIDRADLTGANMFGANLNRVQGRGAVFARAYMKDIAMEESDFVDSDFTACFMQRAVLIGTDLKRSNLTEVTLSGGALEDADLSGAQLLRTLLNGARLDRAVFDGANLDGARFVNAVLHDTRFEGVHNMPPHLQEMLDSGKK